MSEIETPLMETALVHLHQKLGAKMVPFAGYLMPVQYEGITIEHETVRNRVGLFDVSHMGEFILKGEGALDLIQRITSNDASKLSPGKAQYSCLPNSNGGIVDDLIVYCLEDGNWMLVVNASNIEKDWNWIQQHNIAGVEMMDISARTSLIAVQGPDALATVQKLTDTDLAGIAYYSFKKGTVAGCGNVLISNTGYTGAGGFELYVENQYAETIWNALMESGSGFGIKPCGLGARDTLRLEMGFCLYGNDIDDTTSPIEAGLGWITKFTKEFTNSVALKAQKESGTLRKLVGFEMTERGIPRHGYPIVDETGRTIGVVTSGTQSPTLQKAIGLGYIETSHTSEGNSIGVLIRDKSIKAQVVKTPFIKR
ncbi:MAG: glycine cleavage system aminomethyltransferase GcvT [Bacteroidota bacterium]